MTGGASLARPVNCNLVTMVVTDLRFEPRVRPERGKAPPLAARPAPGRVKATAAPHAELEA